MLYFSVATVTYPLFLVLRLAAIGSLIVLITTISDSVSYDIRDMLIHLGSSFGLVIALLIVKHFQVTARKLVFGKIQILGHVFRKKELTRIFGVFVMHTIPSVLAGFFISPAYIASSIFSIYLAGHLFKIGRLRSINAQFLVIFLYCTAICFLIVVSKNLLGVHGNSLESLLDFDEGITAHLLLVNVFCLISLRWFIASLVGSDVDDV